MTSYRQFFTLFLFASGWAIIVQPCAQQITQADKNAVDVVRSLAQKIERCPAAEEVVQYKKKWAKVSWGPPREVRFDVEKTKSLVTPYRATITFSIPYSGTDHHKTEQEARQDKSFRLIFLSPAKYTLGVSGDSTVQLERMEIKNALAGTWDDYNPVHPERFCWITAIK